VSRLRSTLALALAAAALSCRQSPTEPVAVPATSSASVIGNPGTWTIRALMPQTAWRYWLAAEAITDASQHSTVYVLGGRLNQAPTDPPATSILAYDATNDRWTTKAARFTGAATNGIGRIKQTLYISGGWDMSGAPAGWTQVSSRVFAYDAAHDRLIRKADMPRATARGVTGVINDKLYVLAGQCNGIALCRNFYRYDPATDKWTSLPAAPHSHRNGAAAVIGSRLYVAGGGATPYQSFDVYDAATNTWSSRGLLPSPRQFAVGTTLSGKFYVVGIAGGEREGSVTLDRNTQVYAPATGAWSIATGYPGPVGEAGQFLLRPFGAARVVVEGIAYLLAVGSGHLFTGETSEPAGTIDPGPPYIFRP
jgi:N-acetylneuraminic acid mutarotase